MLAEKLQIVEPMQRAHHTNYLLALISGVRALLQRGALKSVVVTITPIHLQLLTDAGHVQRLGNAIEWDASLPYTLPDPGWGERWALHAAVRASVDRHRADGLICTTADIDLLPNALRRLLPSRKYWPRKSAGIVHYGYPKGGLSRRESRKRVAYETSWTLSRWARILMVNPIVYEGYLDRGKDVGGRYGLVPDPVPGRVDIGPAQARAELGLPRDGVLVGCVGMMDHRRAVPELLSAFFRSGADFDPAVRMVLAGLIDAGYRQRIDRDYAAELASGRLLLIDRVLTDREVLCGYAALDLHSMLQYRRFNLSANVLKCVAADRPFVCDAIGHAQLVARRFDAGVVCDVSSRESIATALAAGLRKSASIGPVSSHRLLEFHSVENFAKVGLASVLGDEVYRILGRPCGWEHAYGARPAPAPALVSSAAMG